MKLGFFHLLFVAMIVIAIYSVHNYQVQMASVWADTAAQQAVIDLQRAKQDARIDAQAHAQRAQLFTGILQGVGVSIVLLSLASGAVFVWRIVDKRRESWARAVDGTFALQTMKAGGQMWMTDPNKSAFGVFGIDTRNGALTTDANMVGPDRQLTYAQTIQATRTMAAMRSGNGRMSATDYKAANGQYDQQRQLDYRVADESAQRAEFKALTTEDAFSQSTTHNWILGQSKTTGELFTIDPKEQAHYGIVGATGTGKTAYMAFMLMAIALKSKYRITILDGKGGADWSKYKSVVEYSPLDYSNVSGFVSQLTAEYEKRQAVLNQYQVNSIWELPNGVIPRPTMILVDEFGAVMDSLKAASKNEYKRVELELGNLLRLSRGCGLYVVLCDQNPTRWPSTVRANMPMSLCFRLGGNIGNAINEYNLDKLERVGEFQVSGQRYNGFETYKVINKLLPADYRKPQALLTAESGIGSETGGVVKIDSDTPQNGTSSRVLSSSTREPDLVLASSEPILTGRALSSQDKELILRVHARTHNKTATCKTIWGRKNGDTWQWLNEVLQGRETLQ